LDIRTFWESAGGRQIRKELRKASQTLEISLTDILVEESTNEAAYLSHLVDGSGPRVIGIARGVVAGQDPSGQDPDTCRPR
jgi:hypothetical protein